MIISASYKTDIPAFYGDWFLTRLDAGFCRMVNPYGGQRYRVSLARDDVDGMVFWTRNATPFAQGFGRVGQLGFPFMVQFSATAYPRALDAGTIVAEAAFAAMGDLARRFGPRAVVWRYDPIVFTSLTDADWHAANFAHLCRLGQGVTDEVVVSVAQIYRKTKRNMDRAAARHGFHWWDPIADEKRALLLRLANIATDHGLKLSLCAQRDLLVDGVADAACIDLARLSDIAGTELTAPRKPHRAGAARCGCWASKDIGDYDTCPHGCVYCYAVKDRDGAKARFSAHDPTGEFLGPLPD